MEFYDRFHDMSAQYLLPTTPLDAIVLSLGYEGLFPPALGTIRYSICGKGMMELLPHLIKTTMSPIYNATLRTVRSESANGYDLLWRLLRLFVPGFDKSKPIVIPFWTEDSDIFDFAKLTTIYFRLQQLHHAIFSDYDKSTTFLNGLAGSAYSDQVNTLLTTVDSHNLEHSWSDAGDAGLLPEHLRIPALASRLHHFVQRRMTNALQPFANRANFNEPYPEHAHPEHRNASRLGRGDYDTGPRTRDNTTTGYPQYSDPGRHRPSGILRTPNRTTTAQPSRARFPQPTRGSLPNPSRTRRPFVNTQCPACGKTGHTTQTCDMLAMAISLRRFLRDQVSTEMMTKIEEDWLAKHRDRLQQTDSRTPRQILRAYADDNDLTVADINDQIDWNAWDMDASDNNAGDTDTEE